MWLVFCSQLILYHPLAKKFLYSNIQCYCDSSDACLIVIIINYAFNSKVCWVTQEVSQYQSLLKKKVFMNVCLILSGYWDRAVWIFEYRSILNDNKKKELLTVNIILILM